MKAPSNPRARCAHDLNQLRRGDTYRAQTSHGTTVGEYLGMETPHGHRAILLRHDRGTASIALRDIKQILPAAA